MALPDPSNYNSWQEFARTLVSALGEEADTAQPTGTYMRQGDPVDPSQLPQVPDGWAPVWWSIEQAELYLANPAFDPPTAPDLFQIDTSNLADAAVVTAKIANQAVDWIKIKDLAVTQEKLAALSVGTEQLLDLAVSGGKLQDAAVGTTKLQDLAVVQAKIGLAAVGAAQIGLAQIGTAHIVDAAIVSAKIANAAIVTALIGDAQIVQAKIADLAVNDAKIANLAVTSAKIALLAVGNTHIQDAAITRAKILDGEIINAKIGNIIQSSGYDGTNGWQIDKTGSIRGTNITILNSNGTVAFASGHLVNLASQVTGLLSYLNVNGLGALATQNTVSTGQVTGLGSLALLNSITPSNTSGFGALALKNLVTYGTGDVSGFGTLAGQSSIALSSGQLTGFGALASQSSVNLGSQVTGSLPLTSTSGSLDISRTTGFGSLAAISLLTSGNISTYIAGAAIGGALIANAAIGTANIDNLAVTAAKIAALAVGTGHIQDAAITNAKIGNAEITSAKIAELIVSKLSSGSLDAVIDVNNGLLRFTVGASQLILGNGFGTSNQFFLWYGPTQASPATCSESTAVVFLKTSGQAYFGGSLSAGTIKNAIQTTNTNATASLATGVWTSLGGTRQVVLSYTFDYYAEANAFNTAGNGSTSATVQLYRNGVLWYTLNVTGDWVRTSYGGVGNPATYTVNMGGSATLSDTAGGTSVEYTATLTSRSTGPGISGTIIQDSISQNISIVQTEG